jgi:twitching motility protein PilU
MKKSREQGMVTFDQSLFDLYEEGEISYQDALRLADSANEVRLMIKLHGTRDQGGGTGWGPGGYRPWWTRTNKGCGGAAMAR